MQRSNTQAYLNRDCSTSPHNPQMHMEEAVLKEDFIRCENRAPRQLSGGQQQRVTLARALVMQPKILLLDRPLSNLDAKLRIQMRTEIRRLQQRLGITSVYVTHDQAEAMTLSDRIVVMNNGRVEQVGTPQEIYQKPDSVFVADFIGKANFIESRVEGLSDSALTVGLFDDQTELPPDGRSFGVGDDVFLVIRPEAVHLVENGSGYPGEVRRSTYFGPLGRVRSGGGRSIHPGR